MKNCLLSCIFLLLSVQRRTYSQTSKQFETDQKCQAASENCRLCLIATPNCTWCPKDNYFGVRCRIRSENIERCSGGNMIEGQFGSTEIDPLEFSKAGEFIGDEDINNVVQLVPKNIRVKIRQGETRKVDLKFRRVIDYPLDLYYVMDLSYSMKDDLQNLQGLGNSLPGNIQNITNNVRLGFGTFVDKVMMPYASTVEEQLINPCLNSNDEERCDPVFGFRHQLSITANGSAFQAIVNATKISGNIDSPEGGFDALMQIAVCQNEINWRKNALRVILFTTDASSHIAMDGKLAAILEINDMKCHLGMNVNPHLRNATLYSKSKLLDYPSIGQLKKAFVDNNIQAIFAVTEDVEPLYKDLEDLLGNAVVDTLNSDSSNVVSIINRTYDTLRRKIQLTPPASTENIEVTYQVKCADREWVNNSLQCDNIRNGSEAIFRFFLTAKNCPSNDTHRDNLQISSNSIIDEAAIEIEYIGCKCDCYDDRVEKSSRCSGRGTSECGICVCDTGSSGQQCQCTASSTGRSLDEQCRRTEGEELCSGRGDCKCGVCDCHDATTNGNFCQCQSTGCPNNCGGSDKGKCENCDGSQKCNCTIEDGWTFNALTRDCTCNKNFCRRNKTEDGVECSGRGICVCDKCDCKDKYTGTYCETCKHPECAGLGRGCSSEPLRACAQCVYDERPTCEDECDKIEERLHKSLLDCKNVEDPSDSELCGHITNDKDVHVPVTCSSTSDVDGCNFEYRIFWVADEDKNRYEFALSVRKRDRERDCPGPINPLLIVLPVIGGIVLIGLIALILWKIFQTIRDKWEYEQFLEDTKKSQWSKGENPLFHKPTDRIENPAYIGAGK